MLPPLPVDSRISEIRDALERHRAAIVIAAPGAGKTTRIPPALVDRGRVLLLQPRRVAARAMAKRIADERGWTVGSEIGWHIRFDRQFSRHTKLLAVTEGILTAYLQDDPLLADVSTIVVDEFHERSVHADLGLALAKQAWLARMDLRIAVMSATLDAAPIAAFLGDCPVIHVPGTLYPLKVEYAPGESVSAAVRALVPQTKGNILCFLPGVREIASAIGDCASLRDQGIDVVPLHGSLDAAAQDAALSVAPEDHELATPQRDEGPAPPQRDEGPAPPQRDEGLAPPKREARRRVIMATNVAETSLTVPGVSVVIDTGLQKVARYDSERGIDALRLERVTLDSADQRAGRAARLGPGTVRRLWDSRDRLRPHREPEIDRVDLAAALLSILAWGAHPDTFEWFDAPDAGRIASAMSLLTRLGAIDGTRVTDLGRLLQRLPLHPRLGRVLVAGHGSDEAIAACAELTGDVYSQPLRQIATRLLGDRYRAHISDVELRRAVLTGYPDRVARRREGDRGTLATGHGVLIGANSGADHAGWFIALDVTAGRTSAMTQALVRKALPIEPEWLAVTRSEVIEEFDASSGSVKARAVDWYDNVMLRERPMAPSDDRRVELLARSWIADAASQRLINRLAFAGIDADIDALVRLAAQTARKITDVALDEELLAWDVRQQVDRLAPDRLTVPSGRDMRIEYGADGAVSVSVKLQELFGLAETPRIGRDKTPITFHLLAPNGRPVQTTRDLKSFWARTYPEVRKELRGRYPRHPWPDDPWNATPTHRTTRRPSR